MTRGVDRDTPNVFRRLDRLDEPNYWQALAVKRTGLGVNGSFAVTSVSGARTLHAGVSVQRRGVTPFDLVRLEAYRRVNASPASGFAINAERVLFGRLRAGGGYADVDPLHGGLDSDRLGIGRRVFANIGWTVSRSWTLAFFTTRALKEEFFVPLEVRTEVVLTYNALPHLRRTGVF